MSDRLEEHLVGRGLLSRERAEDALRSQALVGGAMDTVLLELGVVREATLTTALGEVSGLQPIYLSDFVPSTAMASELPREDAERLNLAPLSVEEGMLHVAVSHPPPMRGLEALVRKLGRSVAPWVTVDVRVRDWRSKIYGTPLGARETALLATLGPDRRVEEETDASPTLEEQLVKDMAEEAARRVADEPLPLTTAGSGSLHEALQAGVAAAEPEPPAWPTPAPAPSATPAPAPSPLPTPRPGPGPRRARGAGARAKAPVSEWSLPEARNALRAVTGDREGIKDVVLRYALGTFDFAAVFAVVRGSGVGWDARGEGADPVALAQVSFPLDATSVFRTAAMAHGSYAGPVPGDPSTRQILDSIGRRPRSVFVFPVEVRGRLVALLYGDRGNRPVSQRKLSELILFCQDLGHAFAELIVLRKQRRFTELEGEAETREEALAALGWTGGPPPTLEGLGRAAPAKTEPADLSEVLGRLVGHDASARAAAIADLSRSPDVAARALAAQFPGPSAWSRVPVQELPAPEELGPIPAGLARLGAAGARALSRFLDAPSSDTRYVALLTAGSLPHPELVAGVLRGLFDKESDVASAARAAARALRKLPRFKAALPGLRVELAALDPERRALAARALGVLHDRASVEGLIGLTSSDDAFAAQAAAEALIEITRASFGTSTRGWMAWWAENRSHRRAQWLLAGLRHPEAWMRAAALEELSGAFGDTLGFQPDAPDAERESSVQRWETVLLDPRLRAVD